MKTFSNHPTGQETTRELLNFRRTRVRERRLQKANVFIGMIPVVESSAQSDPDTKYDYPHTA